jgi:hypothetical protein
VQNGCSDVKCSLEKVKTMLVCRRWLGSMKDGDQVEKMVIIGEGFITASAKVSLNGSIVTPLVWILW